MRSLMPLRMGGTFLIVALGGFLSDVSVCKAAPTIAEICKASDKEFELKRRNFDLISCNVEDAGNAEIKKQVFAILPMLKKDVRTVKEELDLNTALEQLA